MIKRGIGTCYYPEHWAPSRWEDDARRMVEAGLSWVRIGEFAWSRIEPTYGQLNWSWLDEAVETLGAAGLKVVLGTPTATPPRWMIDRHPDIYALDELGNERKFGSRRHYCFSHEGYRKECERIAELLAERFGSNTHIQAWQIDNEYGCHDTTYSYSNAAKQAFQSWCEKKYQSTDALNQAWGNVFWSMEYSSFDQLDLPHLTVTQENPSYQLAFRRFSSDQVLEFHSVQAKAIRRHSQRPITHNFMGRVTDFDHFSLSDEIDFASWDSYPLGYIEDRISASADHKSAYSRQGDPDFQAFHHDLYRTVGKGKWWVMEQQPGPVNWAPHNLNPLPGMVRLWTWEAFAAGAENVMFFRWRQAPFAQEQMHTGLLRVDDEPAPVLEEVSKVAVELAALPSDDIAEAKIAIVFDYQSEWASQIQPMGKDNHYFDLVFDHYQAARKLGLSIDIIAPSSIEISKYKIVMLPGLMAISEELASALKSFEGALVTGPNANSKTDQFTLASTLPPNIPGLDLKVSAVESLPAGLELPLQGGGKGAKWREFVETKSDVLDRFADGGPAIARQSNTIYCAGWFDQATLIQLLRTVCDEFGIQNEEMPEGVRRRDTASKSFYFNYSARNQMVQNVELEPAGVLWVDKQST